ncbi:MFS transporter [Endozoicomonas atrinae]|uniref:MFS transporter n=1 Tax=Endozoicomonas atrinae TaxID=1333660 RepID=UPI0008246F62|nr:MFS transporter [Endozoicomonas atrinae]
MNKLLKTPSRNNWPVVIIAGGNFIELYDFTLYGFFAPVIAELFFPSESQTISLLATFSGFALGFFIRPIGAILFGHIGDVYGRRPALILSLGLMGLSTLTITLLPSYQQIGFLAPTVLLMCRLLQGLSMSGEVAATLTSLAEHAHPKHQGLLSSLVHVSGISGMIAGSLVATLVHWSLTTEDIMLWGWRIPWLMGALGCIVLASLRIKSGSPENTKKPEQAPIHQVLRKHKMDMLRVGVLNALNGTCFFMVFIYINTYWSEHLFFSRTQALAINTGNMVLMVLAIPLAARLADWIGARKVIIKAVITGIIGIVPCYWLMTQPEPWKVVVGQLAFGVLLAAIYGSGAILSTRLLPSSVRMTGLALGYNTAQGFLGSLSPMIATWLVSTTKIAFSPVLYLLVIYLTGIILLRKLPANLDRPAK